MIQRCRHSGPWLAGLLLALSLALAPAARADLPVAQVQESALPQQARGEWRFDEDGVAFDNVAEGARLAGVVRLGEGRYRVMVRPETTPINPSPWYAFRIIASRPGSVAMEFDYGRFNHRYRPWVRRSGGSGTAGSWQAATDGEFSGGSEGEAAKLLLQLEAGGVVEVSAQPPIRIAEVERWLDALAQRTGGELETIGHSVQGRPLRMLAFGSPDAREVVLVTGRQHPPEVTGLRALLAFVDALAADTPGARAFRGRYRILVAPQLNPDGVVEGHWRTNARGADLNRDWGLFREPETRALADALHRHLAGRERSLAFALDFHSTWYDIFYTVEEDPARLPGGVLRRWMDALDARFPGRIQERPSAATSNVFKNWVFREYGAPSVTYEVGDDTDEATLSGLAGFAAESLMTLLPAEREADGP